MLSDTAVTYVVVSIVLGLLSIVGLLLRGYCRIKQKQGIGADEWCLIVAFGLWAVLAVIMTTLYSVTGAGDPAWRPSMDDVVFALKIEWAGQNIQIASLGFAKISLLLFYRRIFVTRLFQLASNILIGAVSAWTLAILLASIFAKWPVSDEWDPTKGYDLDLHAATICLVAINTFFDFVTLALPLFGLRSLQMNAERKLWIGTIFTLGSLAVVASIVRLYYTVIFTRAVPSPLSLFVAPYTSNVLWAIIEPPVFILSSCFLTYGPIFKSFRAKVTSALSGITGSRGGNKSLRKTGSGKGTLLSGDRANSRLDAHRFQILEHSKDGTGIKRVEHWEMDDRRVSGNSSMGSGDARQHHAGRIV